MYDNDFSALTFEHNAVCVTADYGYNSPHNISVYNANRVKYPNGQLDGISGYAIQNVFHQGELDVNFPGMPPGPCMYSNAQLIV
jgi:lipocalin